MVEIRFRLNCLDADRNLQNSQANRSRTPCGTRIQSAYKLRMQWNREMLSLPISKKLNNVVLLLILIMTENSVVQRGTIPQRGCGQVIDSHRPPRTGNYILAHTDTVGKKKGVNENIAKTLVPPHRRYFCWSSPGFTEAALYPIAVSLLEINF